MSKLAIHGGNPVRTKPFPAYNTIGEEEKRAVMQVLDSGVLSRFLGCWDPDFFGGARILEFEMNWVRFFEAKHAISVNSNTSGLFAAIAAAGVEPGDEVIVSPYTMSASAACILGHGAVPVFADIDPSTFCLDPAAIAEKITPRTRAIVTVDLFGHPFEADLTMALAHKHNLIVIEDAAQAPMARYKGRWSGNLGHMGIFSLNYHKHIHTGEGGMVVTSDHALAEKLQLLRNHGEAVIEDKGVSDLGNIVGQNYRMTEIEAAIGTEQLKKLPGLMTPWIQNAREISSFMGQFAGITPPKEQADCQHSYYVHASKWNAEITGVIRERFVEALRAELPPTLGRESEGAVISGGYVRPLYLQPVYQKRSAWALKHLDNQPRYFKGLCPVTERMHEEELFLHEYMKPHLTREDRQAFYDAFEKVWEGLGELT